MTTKTKRRAFDDPKWTKADLLAQVLAHREADQLIHGIYWQHGKGCAVGCMSHTDRQPHAVLARRYGIDERLFHLCDAIFENLPNEESLVWPERFVEALPVGRDVSLAWHKFSAWLLSESGLLTITRQNRAAIERVRTLHIRAIDGNVPSAVEWEHARAEARLAESTAWSAAAVAAQPAAAAAAARATAWSAAQSAVDSAWQRMSDKLVEVLEAA